MGRETRTVDINEADRGLGALLREAASGAGRIVVREDGVPLAAIVPLDDLERLRLLDAKRIEWRAAFEAVWTANADKDPDEIERDIAEALADVRTQGGREAERLAG